jgi:hypothetical protein
LRNRDTEIILSVLALALRFVDDPGIRANNEEIDSFIEAARNIVAKKIFEGTVELSTIQSLCLLSLVDFTSKSLLRLHREHELTKIRWKYSPCKCSQQLSNESST